MVADTHNLFDNRAADSHDRHRFIFSPSADGPSELALVKILVAEDEAVTRKVLQSTFIGLGWEVVTASDGAEAWGILEKFEGGQVPELAVIDWMMPGLDGLELCRKLRSTRGFELTYIILLTSQSNKNDLAAGSE